MADNWSTAPADTAGVCCGKEQVVTKEEIIEYLYENNVRGDLTIEQMADDLDRPQGEWIKVDDVSISCRCSVCGWEAHLYEDDVYGMPYCPNCGSKMRGEHD